MRIGDAISNIGQSATRASEVTSATETNATPQNQSNQPTPPTQNQAEIINHVLDAAKNPILHPVQGGPSKAEAKTDSFAKFGDIKGESTNSSHNDWLEMLDYSHETTVPPKPGE
jgi:hypothetical protein